MSQHNSAPGVICVYCGTNLRQLGVQAFTTVFLFAATPIRTGTKQTSRTIISATIDDLIKIDRRLKLTS